MARDSASPCLPESFDTRFARTSAYWARQFSAPMAPTPELAQAIVVLAPAGGMREEETFALGGPLAELDGGLRRLWTLLAADEAAAHARANFGADTTVRAAVRDAALRLSPPLSPAAWRRVLQRTGGYLGAPDGLRAVEDAAFDESCRPPGTPAPRLPRACGLSGAALAVALTYTDLGVRYDTTPPGSQRA